MKEMIQEHLLEYDVPVNLKIILDNLAEHQEDINSIVLEVYASTDRDGSIYNKTIEIHRTRLETDKEELARETLQEKRRIEKEAYSLKEKQRLENLERETLKKLKEKYGE